jgi:4-methyl-5(b-hydroxyethyl)-thiazole monophosphate biosynthesis
MVSATAFQVFTTPLLRSVYGKAKGRVGIVSSSGAKGFHQCAAWGACRSFRSRFLDGYPTSNLASGFPKFVNTKRFWLRAAVDGMGNKKALVAVANGSEEIETVTVVDTLVRAGVQVTLASVERQHQVTTSRGVKIVADALITDTALHAVLFDAVVLPGGMPGAEHLRDSQPLMELVKKHVAEGKIVGAICAAPAVALASHHLLDNVKATCYPAPNFRVKLASHAHIDEPVVRDGQFITSQGPGTALAFSLVIAEALCGVQQAEKVAKAMLTPLTTIAKR